MKLFGTRHAARSNLSEGQACGKYLLDHILGKGGMGVVWEALDPESGQRVAIKMIARDILGDATVGARFQDEVRRHARLDHPNIVKLLDTFPFNDQQCMVMSLIPGESLAALLERSPDHALPLGVAAPIFIDVLAALDYAHRKGILHRDVKPSNILLDLKQRAYLVDFGIALAVGEARRTRAGAAVGTAEYMSPEQIRSPARIDHRTDVYSAACVFYEMLTGRPPFIRPESYGTTADLALREAHVKAMPVPPHERTSSIPLGISDLIMSALRKEPDARPQGCAEFARLLGVATTPGRGAQREDAPAGRSARSALIIGLLVFAVAAIVYVLGVG